MTNKKSAGFTVSGAPDVDRCGYPSGPVALSAAITLAQGAVADETTMYVRDPAGDAYGRVEREKDGIVRIYRTVA